MIPIKKRRPMTGKKARTRDQGNGGCQSWSTYQGLPLQFLEERLDTTVSTAVSCIILQAVALWLTLQLRFTLAVAYETTWHSQILVPSTTVLEDKSFSRALVRAVLRKFRLLTLPAQSIMEDCLAGFGSFVPLLSSILVFPALDFNGIEDV
jgi:hypothetical protein